MRDFLFLVIAGAAAAAGVYLVARKFNVTPESFNPLSRENLAYRTANTIVETLTGDKNQTAGGLVYDFVNPRAGLAANEYSPAPGIIVVMPSSLRPGQSFADGAILDGALDLDFSPVFSTETPAGAVFGRRVSRGF